MGWWHRGEQRDAASDASADPAAWATEVPPTERAELRWATHEPSTPTARDPRSAERPPDEPPRSRRAVVTVAALAAFGVLTATVVALSGTDDSSADEPDTELDEPAPETTLATLPPLTTTTEAPDREPADDDEPDSSVGGTGGATTDSGSEPTFEVSTIDLPEPLANFAEPFEVVMATSEGLATLSFPSGTLRIQGDVPTRESRIVVAPDATLIAPFEGGVIVSRDGEIVELDDLAIRTGFDPTGWSSETGSTTFTVTAWNSGAGDDPNSVITFGIDGTVVATEASPATFASLTEDGDWLVSDAGGTYLLAADGSGRRISTGTMVGHRGDVIATRSCDDEYRCSLTTELHRDGSLIATFDDGIPEQSIPLFLGLAAPSPDGRAIVLRSGFEPDASETLLTADGPAITVDYRGSVPSFLGFGEIGGWAPNASGFFRAVEANGGLDRSNLVFITSAGDVVEVPGLPRGISSIGVRSVDAELAVTPAGDVVTVVDDPEIVVENASESLVGVHDGVITHLDLTAGQTTAWSAPGLGERPDLTLVDGAVVGISADGTTAFRSRYGSVVDERLGLDPGVPGPRFAANSDRLTWRSTSDDSGFELVPITFHDNGGRTAWATIEVGTAAIYGTDGTGRLVYQSDDGVRVRGPNEDELLTTGELVAIGPTAALVRECAAASCTTSILDDAGAPTQVGGPFTVARPLSAGGERLSDGTVSPPGDVFAFWKQADDLPATWVFFDTVAAVETAAPPPDPGQPILWEPGGLRAYYLSGGIVQVWERGSPGVRPLTSAGDFDALVAVPEDFAAPTSQ